MTKIQLRRDTSSNWNTANPTPASGEPCFETDTGKLKIGDGTTAYNSLPYQGGGSGETTNLNAVAPLYLTTNGYATSVLNKYTYRENDYYYIQGDRDVIPMYYEDYNTPINFTFGTIDDTSGQFKPDLEKYAYTFRRFQSGDKLNNSSGHTPNQSGTTNANYFRYVIGTLNPDGTFIPKIIMRNPLRADRYDTAYQAYHIKSYTVQSVESGIEFTITDSEQISNVEFWTGTPAVSTSGISFYKDSNGSIGIGAWYSGSSVQRYQNPSIVTPVDFDSLNLNCVFYCCSMRVSAPTSGGVVSLRSGISVTDANDIVVWQPGQTEEGLNISLKTADGLTVQNGVLSTLNMVTTDTAQTLTGEKTFQKGISLNFNNSSSYIEYATTNKLRMQSSSPIEISSSSITLGGTASANQYNFTGGVIPVLRKTSSTAMTIGNDGYQQTIESSNAPIISRNGQTYTNIDSGNLVEQVGVVSTSLLKIDKTGLNQTVDTDTTLDLLNLLSLTGSADNVVTVVGKAVDQYDLTTGVLKMFSSTYNDIAIDIRLTGTIAGSANTAREFLIELQRSDSTVIEKKSVIKVATNDISNRGISFNTFTNTTADPFISGGLKLILNNTSGQTVTVTGVSVLIKSRWNN